MQSTIAAIEIRRNAGVELAPNLMEKIMEMASSQAKLQMEAVKSIQGETADKMLAFIFSNGMTVSGTLGQFKKITKDQKSEFYKLAKSKISRDQVREFFKKADAGFNLDIIGIVKIGGDFDPESSSKTKDAETRETENISKDMKNLFETVEGKFPVIGVDVQQLQNFSSANIDIKKIVIGDFLTVNRTLLHSISMQTLGMKGKIPPFKSDLEKKVESDLEKKVTDLEKKVTGLTDDKNRHSEFIRALGIRIDKLEKPFSEHGPMRRVILVTHKVPGSEIGLIFYREENPGVWGEYYGGEQKIQYTARPVNMNPRGIVLGRVW